MGAMHSSTSQAGVGPRARVLTGDTPTHTGLHLGHYVGSLENRVRLQGSYECYFLIANVHALTTLAERPEQVRENTLGIVKDWMAVGMDPERSVFVLQSEVPAIAELTFLLAMLLPFNKVMRNPTLKTELETKGLGESYSFGFPMYTVGQCADILSFRPELVPVGQDQEAHIEMCRDAALKFNQLYCGVGNRVPPEGHAAAGGVFPVPRAQVGRVGRLRGLDGQQKMSKSLGNAVYLYDEPRAVVKKISGIVTGRSAMTDPIASDHVLLQYIDAFIGGERAAEIRAEYASGRQVKDGLIKQELAEAINRLLEPMRSRRQDLEAPPQPGREGGQERVLRVIREGIGRANAVAEETLMLAKRAMRLDFGARRLEF